MVVPDTRLNKLVVRDTPEVIQEIQALLDEIDQHSPQVRITVSIEGQAQSRSSHAGVAIAGGRRGGVIAGSAGTGSSSSQVQSQQNLLVMSGERGMIHISREVTNTNPYAQFAVNAGLLGPDYLFQTVGTGFVVEPIVVGDVVRLTLTPWMSFLGASGENEIHVDEASSTFSVKSGESVQISSGGYNEALKDQAFGLILGAGQSTTNRHSSIVLQPVILDY